MDWTALTLSIRLGLLTVVLLLPLAFVLARWLAFGRFRGRGFVEALVALPLILPPTVLGFYLLVAFGRASPLGAGVRGRARSPPGLQLRRTAARLAAREPAVRRATHAERARRHPAERARRSPLLRSLAARRRSAASNCRSHCPGIATAAVLTFAHTLGEFGVVLMVGGSIPGETRTIAIAIYDRVQAFDEASAGTMALVLLTLSPCSRSGSRIRWRGAWRTGGLIRWTTAANSRSGCGRRHRFR